jgi:hypothetical protein
MIYAKKTVFAFFMLFAISAVSCDSMTDDCIDSLKHPFFADVCGTVDGEIIEAKIYCDPSDHKTKEIYEKLIVTFSSPEGLEGVTVTLLSSGEGLVRFENVISKDPYYAPMTELFSSLFISGEPLTVKREDDGNMTLCYKDAERDLTYTFDSQCNLTLIEGSQNGKTISLRISSLQKTDEK